MMATLLLLLAATYEEGLQLKKEEKFAQAAAVFEQVVKDQPQNTAALAQWATVLGWLGRFDESIAGWQRAVELAPAEPDYALGLARVQYWKGELEPARQRLDGVLQKKPRDADALVLAGDVAVAQKDPAAARAWYLRARELDPGSAELEKKLQRTQAPLTRRFDAGGLVDNYDTARAVEGSWFAQGSVAVAEALVLSGGYEQLRQFGKLDYRMNLTGYLHPAERLSLTAKAAVSPSAKTVASWEAMGEAELQLADPVAVLATVRHLDFSNNGVTIVAPGVRLGYGPFGLFLQGGAVYSTIFPLQGYGLGRLEYAVTGDAHVYAGFSRGAEAQLLLPPATTTDVTAGVVWQLSRAWGVRLDFLHETREATYTRNSLGSSFNVRF